MEVILLHNLKSKFILLFLHTEYVGLLLLIFLILFIYFEVHHGRTCFSTGLSYSV